jgi:hypothetical protein
MQSLRPAKQPRASTNHTGIHAVHTTSSSCGSGVDDDGQCDDVEFKLDTASVVAEAAVERKEVRRVRPPLSELQVPEWQELAVDRRKWRNVEEHRYSLVLRHKKLDCLCRDTALTNRGPRQKDRRTRVTACTTSRPK